MKLFSDSRTHIEQLDINKYKYPIPIITISPIKEDDDSCVFLFNGGIGNTLQLVRMLDYPFFNKHYLVSFERKAHGGNKNKPARFIWQYLKEMDFVINHFKSVFPNKKIYLLGESWGSHLSILYYKKYGNKIDGVYCWNMPASVADPRKKTAWYTMWLGMKFVWTFFTWIKTTDKTAVDFTELMSTNQDLVRIMKMTHTGVHKNNKLNLLVFLCFGPAWKWVKNNAFNNNLNFIYFQSDEDFMQKKPFIKKLKHDFSDSPHFVFMEKGYHLLLKEEPTNEIIFSTINKSFTSK